MAVPTKEQSEPVKVSGGVAHRIARRRANKAKAATAGPLTDSQGLVEFACECTRTDCERSVSVPLYVYRRLIEAGDQYLLQAGHHAFASYRTIVTVGLMRIEERAKPALRPQRTPVGRTSG